MTPRRRAALVGALVVAVATLVVSVVLVLGQGRAGYPWGHGEGLAGQAPWGSMMGGSWAGDGEPVASLDAAAERAQDYADGLGLVVGEVMEFSNEYYAELVTADGEGATEVLIDPDTGAVGIEYGPAMMWNTAYGMHARASRSATVSAERARQIAQDWLDANRPGLTAGEAEALPGYYTLHTLRDGQIEGMLSVNATTGAVWYHTWHGTFIAMTDEDHE